MADNETSNAARRFHLAISGASHNGSKRDHNEDAYGFDVQRGVAAVADGMGGFERGEVASRTAIEALLTVAMAGRPLDDAFRIAHGKVRKLVKPKSDEKVGSTAVVAAVVGGSVHLGWVGDSRAYLWRGGNLQRLTQDHSLVGELVRRGVITEQEALEHPNRNVVTRGLGLKPQDESPAETRVELQMDDRVLLCTDGLHGYLPESAIADELAKSAPTEVPKRLIDRTLAETEAGDNVTAVLLSFTA